MRIAFGTDEATPVTQHIKEALVARGHEVMVAGEGDAWTKVGRSVGELVATARADRGVVCCWLDAFLTTDVDDGERAEIDKLDSR